MTWKACECCDEWQMIAYGIKHDANCENRQCLRCQLEDARRAIKALADNPRKAEQVSVVPIVSTPTADCIATVRPGGADTSESTRA